MHVVSLSFKRYIFLVTSYVLNELCIFLTNSGSKSSLYYAFDVD